MEKRLLDEKIKNGAKHQIIGNEFYKLNCDPEAVSVIDRIIENKKLFSEKYLVIPNAYLYDQNGFNGVALDYLKDYLTVYDCISKSIDFDVYKIVNIVIDNILKLEDIDVLYYDLHLRNVMVKWNSEVKLIDLDGATIMTEYDDYLLSRNCMLEFVFQCYLKIIYDDAYYKKYSDDVRILKLLKKEIDLRAYFSKEFVEYFYWVTDNNMAANDIDFRGILREINDPEKMSSIRKRILSI